MPIDAVVRVSLGLGGLLLVDGVVYQGTLGKGRLSLRGRTRAYDGLVLATRVGGGVVPEARQGDRVTATVSLPRRKAKRVLPGMVAVTDQTDWASAAVHVREGAGTQVVMEEAKVDPRARVLLVDSGPNRDMVTSVLMGATHLPRGAVEEAMATLPWEPPVEQPFSRGLLVGMLGALGARVVVE